MRSIDITISIPQGERQRRRTKRVVEAVAEILEDRLNEIDGDAWRGDRDTLADKLGISDTVPMVTSGRHTVEIAL